MCPERSAIAAAALVLVAALAAVSASSCSTEGKEAKQLALTSAGLATPECALHDADADVYLISNINGSPVAKDGNGFVSRIAPDDGRVLELKWLESGQDGDELHAPKGMAFAGQVLWLADIDTVRKFDRQSGKPLGAVPIPGATFLNDVSTAGDAVFVSDMGVTLQDGAFVSTGTDAIWRIGADGKAEVFHKSAQLKQPNGILAAAAGDAVFAVSWESGELMRVTRERVDTLAAMNNQLDGLVQTAPDRFFVSSWAAGAIYRVVVQQSEGQQQSVDVRVVEGRWQSPADIGWDRARQRLLVPLFQVDHFVTVGVPNP